ncbi:MAG: N-acetylglucosamine kinase [Chitinophagaceae bacterium]|nr:N-acetylglucosamine kinase [Chitinophagaceae bacterium]
MAKMKLIADSGSTKTEWCLLGGKKARYFYTQGLSPYFLNKDGVRAVLQKELLPRLKKLQVDELYFYGTGCKSAANKRMMKSAFQSVFPEVLIKIEDDVTGAAIGLCGREKGIAAILGTGSSSCYFNGQRIVRNSPGIGYVLGDEGSGAFLGKMVIQHYMYGIMDDELEKKFLDKYGLDRAAILEAVYHREKPNRFLAAFTIFLAENRGHYMVENIIVDGLNTFFYTHLVRFKESSKYPVNFTGGVAYVFRDVIASLCADYGFKLGNIYKTPMEGLKEFHKD